MHNAKHSVPLAHIIIVATLCYGNRDTFAGFELVEKVHVDGVSRIFRKVYFVPNPIIIDPYNTITYVGVDSLGRKGNATNGYG
jgi:hypothetical protein